VQAFSVTADALTTELRAVPDSERGKILESALERLYPASAKAIARLIRRIENPDIPEAVWRGIEDAEDGRFVDMELALAERPSWLP